MPPAHIHDRPVHPSSTRPARILINIGLGTVFVLGITFTAYMLTDSWGEEYWIFTTAVAIVMCALVSLRERQRLWTTTAGMALTAAVVVVSRMADLPQEPSPMTALALAVLVGSSIRTLPAWRAAAIAVGGAAVGALAWSSGPTGVTIMATLLITAGLVAGPLLRSFAPVRWSGAPPAPSPPRRPRR